MKWLRRAPAGARIREEMTGAAALSRLAREAPTLAEKGLYVSYALTAFRMEE